MQRRSTWLLVLLLLACSCSRKIAQPEGAQGRDTQLIDRSPSSHLEPQRVLHKVFSVSDHTQFAFSVPPHQRDARLLGNFRSFTDRNAPDATGGTIADVELMVLNEQELDDFLHGRPVSGTYELDPSHNQRVEWKVPPTSDQPQAYYLVFSNSAGGAKVKFVEADFTINFE